MTPPFMVEPLLLNRELGVWNHMMVELLNLPDPLFSESDWWS